jgi:hypothetical protein
MRRLLYVCAALATSGAAYVFSAAAHAASGYWNNSGFSISHEFYPGRHSSYFNYSPTYIGGNRYYFGGLRPRPREDDGGARAPAENTPVPLEWAKKCGSSCLDLSGDR